MTEMDFKFSEIDNQISFQKPKPPVLKDIFLLSFLQGKSLFQKVEAAKWKEKMNEKYLLLMNDTKKLDKLT